VNGFIQHHSGAIEMPSTVTYTGLVNYSVAGTGYRYCYQSSILSDLNKTKLLTRSNPVVVKTKQIK
jgi:hypothetical protein